MNVRRIGRGAVLRAKQDIRELAARYNRAWDAGRSAEWAGTFTPDGCFKEAGRVYRGRSQLIELRSSFPASVVHFTSDYLIDVDGDRARASCSLLLFDRDRGFKLAIFGHYADDLVRTARGWQFSTRAVEAEPIDWPYEAEIWTPLP